MALIAAARILHRQLRAPREVALMEYAVVDANVDLPRGPDQGDRLRFLLAQGSIRLLAARSFAWPGARGLFAFRHALAACLRA